MLIGIQLENKLTRDVKHILTLKKIAREIGFAVPLYSMTGWMRPFFKSTTLAASPAPASATSSSTTIFISV
ncbi:MAG: hypothetical protein JO117_11730, partial [Verrucomicrobia bacterium]|nr:hypothetical protein [Verrucomicrobiota bacterium]